jgi:hypothetical protein
MLAAMSQTAPSLRSHPALRGLLPAIAGLLAMLIATSPKVLNDGDSWWHVAAGRMMIARRAVLTTDPFSWTVHGQPWFTHEWLSEVLFGGAFNLAGWSGVVLLTAAAAALTAWLLAREVGRWLSGLPQIALVTFGLLLWSGSLLARPHMLALPILAAWTAELVRARAGDRGPRWWFAPLMTLWANLHGSFIFGLALIGPFALEALLAALPARRMAVVLRWGGFGLAATALAALTPHGVQTLLFPLGLIHMTSLASIGEWAASDFSTVGPLEIALLAGLFVAVTRPVRMPLIRAGLLAVLIHLALQHVRYDQMLGIVGALILAQPLAGAYAQTPPIEGRRTSTAPILGLVAAALAIAIVAARLVWPVTLHDGPTRPISAVAAVPPAIAATPVLNDYSFGGYLIGRGIPVFVDGRADLYGDAFLRDYARLIAPDRAALTRTLDGRHIGWAILIPGSPIAHAMDEAPGWRRFRTDRWAAVYVRATTAAP